MKGKLEMVIVVIGLVMCSGVLMTASSPMMMGYGSAYVQDLPEGGGMAGGNNEIVNKIGDAVDIWGIIYNVFYECYETYYTPTVVRCTFNHTNGYACMGFCDSNNQCVPNYSGGQACRPPKAPVFRTCRFRMFSDCDRSNPDTLYCGELWPQRCEPYKYCNSSPCFTYFWFEGSPIESCRDSTHECNFD